MSVSAKRDFLAARRFFARAILAQGQRVEVVTDRAPALRAAIAELMPAELHNTEQYANNRIECDHGWFKADSGPCAPSNATTPPESSCAATR